MGMINAPQKCFITDSPTVDKPSPWHAIEYITEYAGQRFYFCFNPNHENSKFVEENKYILQGLIINHKLVYDGKKVIYDNERLERIIREAIIPKTPKEKLDNLINLLFSLQKYEGSEIEFDSLGRFDSLGSHEILIRKLYLKNYQEYWFYLSTLKSNGFISFLDVTSLDGNDAINIRLTYSGLEYVINLQESGDKSNKCFIAMHFVESMEEVRKTIKNVVISCGYQPILIDEVNYESDITINDAIIRNIKECKFLIADFSGQRHGVYFEAGYALGKGRQVIYLCNEQDFNNIHFDTNHYPHIVYSNTNDLRLKLTNKIKAWID